LTICNDAFSQYDLNKVSGFRPITCSRIALKIIFGNRTILGPSSVQMNTVFGIFSENFRSAVPRRVTITKATPKIFREPR
jgi:hypothetical protein